MIGLRHISTCRVGRYCSRNNHLEFFLLMTPFVFRAEQFVPRPIAEVFDFFSKAENLEKLTPTWLHFHIRSVDPAPIRQGTLIQYSLRWRIFPIRWTTEIV